MQDKIEKFKDIVIQNFSRADFEYHEWMVDYHLEVVERIAMELCDIYPEANRDIAQVLVWFHDFGKPFDDKKEREITLDKGSQALLECGFGKDFIDKVVEFWQIMEKKNEIDLSTAPIETQIISSADGASHFIGVFYPSYFGDGDDFLTTQQNLKKKIEVDWERKIVLPEVKKAFKDRYEKQKELLGEFPRKFINFENEYDSWNLLKKDLSVTNRRIFDKGEIWYISVGKNIGYEQDGKNIYFERPVLITRKFNKEVFLGVPLTSVNKEGKYYFKLKSFNNSVAILSQIRLFDSKRLLRRIGKIDHKELLEIKSKLRTII